MSIVPVLAEDALAATVKATLPLPDPLAPEVMVIQLSLLAAVQAQPVPAVTATAVPAPPLLPIDWLVGLIDAAHPPPCVTVNVCPAIVMVPVRAAPVFALAAKVTVPLPLPDAPVLTVSHGALLTAVQAQPAATVTSIEAPAPPALAMD
jgi:hypothetical protein